MGTDSVASDAQSDTPSGQLADQVLGPRDHVVVAGADAQRYLHSQLSQRVDDLAVGESRWTFALDPTGKIVALARITRADETRFVLDTDAGYGDVLAARLNRFKIRVAADIEVVPLAVSTTRDDAARIAARWPAMGAEIIPDETLVAGTGLAELAVDFKKGCYPGQELVERMDSRGASAPRVLQRVTVAQGSQPGSPYTVDGEEAGTITSVAGDQALAWVKRNHLDPSE